MKALRLNRTVLVVARRVWVRYNLHPPEQRTSAADG